jgi:general secretion pathway protein J
MSHSRAGASRQDGFSLIEVLLATVLLAAGLALAFASLRAATGTTQRGESLAQRSERMRAVEGFLRRRIAGARPILFGTNLESGLQERFIGDEAHMRFVADTPDYLGRGGPYLHELAVEDQGEGVRLTVALTMVQAGTLVPERPPRPPEALVEDMDEIRFRYRAMTADNRLGEWQDTWEDVERMPLQVQVLLRDRAGRDWPALVVSLPLASSYTAMAGMGQ